MNRNTNQLKQVELQALFDYKDGELLWKVGFLNRKQGFPCGYLNKAGYKTLCLNKKSYLIHRLVSVYFNGDMLISKFKIDHIDENKQNNKAENLRLVTESENHTNRKRAKGYYYNKIAKKYQAYICKDGVNNYLGLFKDEKDAKLAYINAKERLHKITEKEVA